jgi:hypothetical protein
VFKDSLGEQSLYIKSFFFFFHIKKDLGQLFKHMISNIIYLMIKFGGDISMSNSCASIIIIYVGDEFVLLE